MAYHASIGVQWPATKAPPSPCTWPWVLDMQTHAREAMGGDRSAEAEKSVIKIERGMMVSLSGPGMRRLFP